MENAQWATLARDLGAQAFESSWDSGGDDRHKSFAMRLRERRGPAPAAITRSHVLLGSHRGTRYLLSHEGAQDSVAVRLRLAVEVDPSLELCAYVSPGTWSRGALKTKQVHLGDPALDSQLCLEAADPPRLAELLRPQSEADLSLLRVIVDEGYVVTDTTVVGSMLATVELEGATMTLHGIPRRPVTASEVLMKVERMTWVGREVTARASRVHVPPEAQRSREVWAAVARSRALAFDPARRLIQAESPAGRFSVGVETRLAALAVEESFAPFSTYLAATFARPLALGLRVEKAGMLNRVWEILGGDIVIGDKPFDRAFKVSGADAEAVRARLRPVAAPLVEAHALAAELTLDDGGLFLLIPGIVETPERLNRVLDLSTSIVDALGVAPPQAGYR